MARVANHEATSPETRPSAKQERGLLDYKQYHVRPLRAESHADADFAGAAADGIGHEAVKADQREEQSDGSEDCEQRGLKAALRAGFRLQFAHGLNVAGGEVGIDGVQEWMRIAAARALAEVWSGRRCIPLQTPCPDDRSAATAASSRLVWRTSPMTPTTVLHRVWLSSR